MKKTDCIIIGGGPSGLIAAEILSAAGKRIVLYERKPSLGRKFLMAGRGGLNLTHSEPIEKFLTRYGSAEKFLFPMIHDFSPTALMEWSKNLGEETFTGTSGRVFPKSMKASPLLRSWIARLRSQGVEFKMSRTWTGWDQEGNLTFSNIDGTVEKTQSKATLLALGGASWPTLGSDGSWVKILEEKSISITPLLPANCGFHVSWSPYFSNKFAGMPLKNIAVSYEEEIAQGEMVITKNGIEGGVVYALSSTIRNKVGGILKIDVRPMLSHQDLKNKLDKPRGRQSFSTYLQKTLNLSPVTISLLHETTPNAQNLPASELASILKSIPIHPSTPFPIDRAISTAGGIALDALDKNNMIKKLPGIFTAGEMLDWEAPTGGYLLQASFATGVHAAKGILEWLEQNEGP